VPGGAGQRRPNARSHKAILEATGQLLAEVGYGAMTMEGIAARAGVGKATVYRWWSSKAALAIDVLGENPSEPADEDTGDLRGDLVRTVERVIALLTRGLEGEIIPAMSADLVRDPAMAELFRTRIARPRRSSVTAILDRATARGELPKKLDVPLMLDACVGAIFYRLVISGEPVTDEMAGDLVDLLLDGARARTPKRRTARRRPAR
jgi:AcrR family transcriptional regulator